MLAVGGGEYDLLQDESRVMDPGQYTPLRRSPDQTSLPTSRDGRS